MATIAGLTGIVLPGDAGEDSFDQSELFMGRSDVSARDHIIHHAPNGVFALRKGDWLLIDAGTGEVTPEPEWFRNLIDAKSDSADILLYNLESDPKQINNLSLTNTEKTEELKLLLEKIRKAGRSASL
jgi:hypothetical protein